MVLANLIVRIIFFLNLWRWGDLWQMIFINGSFDFPEFLLADLGPLELVFALVLQILSEIQDLFNFLLGISSLRLEAISVALLVLCQKEIADHVLKSVRF